MSRKNVGFWLVLAMSFGFSTHLISPRADAGSAGDRNYCRAIVKLEGIPSSMIESVKGKVYSFEPEILNGESEWPLEKKNGVISANISLPREMDFSESPLNIQTALMAKTAKGNFKCTGEVNVMRVSYDDSPIVLYSTCEESI